MIRGAPTQTPKYSTKAGGGGGACDRNTPRTYGTTLEVLCFSIQLNFIDWELCAVVNPHQKERSNAAFGNGNGVTEFLKNTLRNALLKKVTALRNGVTNNALLPNTEHR